MQSHGKTNFFTWRGCQFPFNYSIQLGMNFGFLLSKIQLSPPKSLNAVSVFWKILKAKYASDANYNDSVGSSMSSHCTERLLTDPPDALTFLIFLLSLENCSEVWKRNNLACSRSLIASAFLVATTALFIAISIAWCSISALLCFSAIISRFEEKISLAARSALSASFLLASWIFSYELRTAEA